MIDLLDDLRSRIGIDFAEIGVALLRVAIIVVLGIVVSRIARTRVETALARRSFGRNGALLVGRAISTVVFVTCGLLVLGSFGATWTGLLAFVSVGTVAIGLAVQDVLKNFFAGIFLLLERPFRTGDFIRIREIEGEVQGIDVRTTLVRTIDGSLVMIPNAIVFAEVLTNRSRRGTRRVDLKVTEQHLDARQISEAIERATRDLAAIRRPIPAPLVRRTAPGETVMAVSLLIDDMPEPERELLTALRAALPDAAIEVGNA